MKVKIQKNISSYAISLGSSLGLGSSWGMGGGEQRSCSLVLTFAWGKCLGRGLVCGQQPDGLGISLDSAIYLALGRARFKK